jgi:hypothetical protein
VIALAISLVLIRDIPNGPVVPGATTALSDALPEYYVALPWAGSASGKVLGDLQLGKEPFPLLYGLFGDRTFTRLPTLPANQVLPEAIAW